MSQVAGCGIGGAFDVGGLGGCSLGKLEADFGQASGGRGLLGQAVFRLFEFWARLSILNAWLFLEHLFDGYFPRLGGGSWLKKALWFSSGVAAPVYEISLRFLFFSQEGVFSCLIAHAKHYPANYYTKILALPVRYSRPKIKPTGHKNKIRICSYRTSYLNSNSSSKLLSRVWGLYPPVINNQKISVGCHG